MNGQDSDLQAQFDSLTERLFGPEDPSEAVPPLTRPGCIPLWAFEPDRTWNTAETGHIASCVRCQRNLTAMWEHNGLASVWSYFRSWGARLSAGLRAEPRFALFERLYHAPWEPASIGGLSGRSRVVEDLGFAAAASDEKTPLPLLINFTAGEGEDLDLSIWEETGDLNVLGKWLRGEQGARGNVLGVELWDENGSHPWRIPFRETPDGPVAALAAPMPGSLAGEPGKRVVAIAWTEKTDSN